VDNDSGQWLALSIKEAITALFLVSYEKEGQGVLEYSYEVALG